jgi:predicted transcriptional regulator
MIVEESRFEGRDLSVVQHRDLRRLADYWLIKRRD